jgi:hypothetical protein
MVTAYNVAKIANDTAILFKGLLIDDEACDLILLEVASKLNVSVDNVRVFCFNLQSASRTVTTAWVVNAKSTGVTTTAESVIPRPELFGCPGRNFPGAPSESSSAMRTSATTGVTTLYGVGQVKDSNNSTVQQVLKIAVSL